MSIMRLSEKSAINNLEGIHYFHKKVTYKTADYFEIKNHLKKLYALNTKTYNLRYDEDYDTVLHYPKNMNEIKNVHNEYSLLKSLKCLASNIDIEELEDVDFVSYEETKSYEFLIDFIEQLKNYIISENDLYKSAAWE